MSETIEKQNVDEIVQNLISSAGELDYNEQESRIFIQAARTLAQGIPLTPEELTKIGEAQGLSGEQADEILTWVAERNDEKHIVGLAGLSLNDWNHTLRVAGRDLNTWCALDTLYLTPILAQDTEVESHDPTSKQLIKISVTPEGAKSYSPSEAVISIVIPQIPEGEQGLESAEAIWNAFCSYSHYFESFESAQAWFADKDVEPILLSIEEGHELGRKWFAKVNQYA